MKRALTFITVMVLLSYAPQTRAAETKPDTVAEQLRQIEQRLIKAAVEMDIETYSSFLAADWKTIDLTGRVLTKAQVIEELSSKKRRIENAVIDDVAVRELGDVAVVTGRTTATGSYEGKSVTVVLRFTDVFVKRDGRWQVVASQGTQVMK